MITIIGGGLGGLALARGLHLRGIEFCVYESDALPNVRHQGGMLDLHEDSGQAALRKVGLFEQFQSLVLPHGDGLRILDKQAVVRLEHAGNGSRPEIERGDLRRLLLASLPEDTIKWGRRVSSVRRIEPAVHQVSFANGSSVTTTMLVGADGAWSKIRPLVSDVRPEYLGLCFVESRLHEAAKRHPRQADLIGLGSMFALSDEKGIFAHREPNHGLSVYAALRTPTPWRASCRPTREEVLAYFPDWSPDLRDLIARSDEELVPRAIDTLPAGHRWTHQPGVTLIGDAAHLMSPFAGEGANLALLDGVELAQMIAQNPNDFESAVEAFEAAMFVHSQEAALKSERGLAKCFTPNAPDELIDFFQSLGFE